MKIKNPWSQNIRILYVTTQKRDFITQKCQPLKGYVNVALSTWSGIILNNILHQMGVARRWSACDTADVLWKPRIALIAALNSSVWLGLVSLTFLLTIQHRFSVELRSGQLAGQLSPIIPWSVHKLPVVLTLWASPKCFWLQEILISIKHVNLRKL